MTPGSTTSDSRLPEAQENLKGFSYLDDELEVELAGIVRAINDGYIDWAVVLCGIVAESILKRAAEYKNIKVARKEEGLGAVEHVIRQRDNNYGAADASERIIVDTPADRLIPTIGRYRNSAAHHKPNDRLTPADAQTTIESTVELLGWYEGLLPDETRDRKAEWQPDPARWVVFDEGASSDLAPTLSAAAHGPTLVYDLGLDLLIVTEKSQRTSSKPTSLRTAVPTGATTAIASFDGLALCIVHRGIMTASAVSVSGSVTRMWQAPLGLDTHDRLLAFRHRDQRRRIEAVVVSGGETKIGRLGPRSKAWSPHWKTPAVDASNSRDGWMLVDPDGSVRNAPSLPARALEGSVYAIDAVDLAHGGGTGDQMIALAVEVEGVHELRLVLNRGGAEAEVRVVPLGGQAQSVHAARLLSPNAEPAGGAVVDGRLLAWTFADL